jgi:hypothetical protein
MKSQSVIVNDGACALGDLIRSPAGSAPHLIERALCQRQRPIFPGRRCSGRCNSLCARVQRVSLRSSPARSKCWEGSPTILRQHRRPNASRSNFYPGLAKPKVAELLFNVGESCFEHVTDRFPRAAVELNKSQLLDRSKVPRSSADFDPGQQNGALVVFEGL